MNDKWNAFAKNMFKIGTVECAVFFGAAAMVLALLFLLVGFWQTLLIAALVLVGVFLGGVKDKKDWIRNLVNRLFPPKQNVPFRERNEEIEKAVRESRESEAAPAEPKE